MTEETLHKIAALKHERDELKKAREMLCKSGVKVGVFERTCGDNDTYYARLRSSEWVNLNLAMYNAASEWISKRLQEIDHQVASL